MKATSKLTLAAALCGLAVSLNAQPTLADLVAEAQADWMVGTWVGYADDGTQVTQTFSWDLDKQVIVMRGSAGDMSWMGVTSIDPTTGEPRYVGWDNRGTHSTGTWADEGGDVALRLESKQPDGQTRKMAVVFGRASGGRLEIRFHGVDQWGYIDYPARFSIQLKKKAETKKS
ncbi:MAG: hypothetical protein D6766_04545 [Verrucomicrobia bacterium]|nr:MAG: hypothetical protein D6766_04545 [Verrucomicrobiota bacterium]